MNRLRPLRTEYDFGANRLVVFLRDHLDGQRVLQVGSRGLPANWGSALGIAQIDTLDAATLKWYYRFFDQRFGTTPPFPAIRYPRRTDTAARLESFDLQALDLLAVRFVVVDRRMVNYQALFTEAGFELVFEDGRATVFRNRSELPRARLVRTVVESSGIPGERGLTPGKVTFTEDRGLLEAARLLGIPTLAARALSSPSELEQASGSVALTHAGHARVDLDVELEHAGILVLADTWHPAWRATVDGLPAHVGKVDDVVRGVAVAAGSHAITFRYRPRSLPMALVVSPTVLTALLLVSLRRGRHGDQSGISLANAAPSGVIDSGRASAK
jgi:hypothetical protein